MNKHKNHISAENLIKLTKPDQFVTDLVSSKSIRFDCNGHFFSGTKSKNIKELKILSCLGVEPRLVTLATKLRISQGAAQSLVCHHSRCSSLSPRAFVKELKKALLKLTPY